MLWKLMDTVKVPNLLIHEGRKWAEIRYLSRIIGMPSGEIIREFLGASRSVLRLQLLDPESLKRMRVEYDPAAKEWQIIQNGGKNLIPPPAKDDFGTIMVPIGFFIAVVRLRRIGSTQVEIYQSMDGRVPDGAVAVLKDMKGIFFSMPVLKSGNAERVL